ncbi:MAG: HTH-type transcriptional activator RhaS [Bacteroides rodentium]
MGLEVLSDFSEVIPYPVPDLPLYAGIGRLGEHNRYTVSRHFHPDFEFSLVLDGTMDYFVNGKDIHLQTGDGIFVNSRRLHYNYSGDRTPCRYLVITLSPVLFPTSIPVAGRLMEEKSDHNCSDYVLLEKESHESILAIYPIILHEIEQGSPNVFLTLSYALTLYSTVIPLIQTQSKEGIFNPIWLSLYDMTKYIHAHYRDKITLGDIASAGGICRSRCCHLFTEYMGQSPIDYTIAFRLEKGCKMLRNTSCSIGEVASKCGFSGQSYFTQAFRNAYGMTPTEYRKRS